MCSSTPDTSGINRAAEANAKVAQDALDWYKQQYKDQAPMREQAGKVALDQAKAQTDLSRFALERGQQEAQRYDTTFKPIEDSIAADAMNYDTPARREAEARSAVADTEINLAAARDGSRRALERRGVMPGSGASLALEGSQNLGAAKLRASAANTARQRVETIGAAKKMDAAGLGRGVVSNQATQTQIGLQAGNSGVANAQVPLQVAQQGTATMGQGFQTAMQGNSSSGSLYAQAANAQAAGNNDGLWGALGNVAGAALYASDRKVKKKVRPVKGEMALACARRIPVKSWQYKKGKGDGGSHVGPMAQDVHAAMGEQAAPGGKQIDLVSMNGMTLAAVKELDRKVSRLEQAKKRARA